jgi:hypothetical protein
MVAGGAQEGWRRKGVLVLSRGLLERVAHEPRQLQLLLAAAMAPLCTWGGLGWDPLGEQPATSGSSPGTRVALADALTAAALVLLAPGVLLAAAPPQVVAMLPGLAPSLQVAARLALLGSDRAVQLVVQSEQQQEVLLQLHTMAVGVFDSSPAGGDGGGGGSAATAESSRLLQAWLEHELEQGGASASQLDELMQRLAQDVAAAVYEGEAAGGSDGDGAGRGATSLARLRALEARRWLLSLDGYPAAMATARPLRRVILPAGGRRQVSR